MKKRLKNELQKLKYENQPIKFSFIGMTLMFFCLFLLITATFLQVPFEFQGGAGEKLFQYLYVPQVPAVMFIAVLLGVKMGVSVILLYILLGMFFPIFALGGGPEYILKPVFGYIVAYVPAVMCAGVLTKKDASFLGILKSAAACTFIIHFLGMMYSFSVMAITNVWSDDIFNFLFLQSGIKLLYDYILCILAAYIANMAKRIIWVFAG